MLKLSTYTMSMVTYKRLIYEYSKMNTISNTDNNLNISEFEYKIHNISGESIIFKSEISIKYNNNIIKINIYYDNQYPFKPPYKIEMNNIDIKEIYKILMKNNSDIFKSRCLCCESILCQNIWCVTNTIYDVFENILKIYNLRNLYEKRLLLNKIFMKYTNQDISYIHQYLIQ